MRSKTIFAVVCALQLGTGVLIGIGLDRTVLPAPTPRGPEAMLEREMASLDLTSDQRRQLVELMKRRAPQFERVFQEVRPKIEAVEAEADAELRTILTPPQFQHFFDARERMKRELPGMRK